MPWGCLMFLTMEVAHRTWRSLHTLVDGSAILAAQSGKKKRSSGQWRRLMEVGVTGYPLPALTHGDIAELSQDPWLRLAR